MTKVYYPSSFYESDFSILSSKLDTGITLVTGEKIPEPADFNILISGKPSKEQIIASPELKYLIIPWAGVSEDLKNLMKSFPHIKVHNLHHNAVPTAETAIMLLLAAAKQSVSIDKVFRKNDWTPRYKQNPAQLLYGKTILILGFGKVGQHVARICNAIGMRVIAVRRDAGRQTPEGIDAEVFNVDDLHDLLPKANVLVCTLPLTSQTDGLIGAHEISLLQDKAIVVNVGRGKVIDQEAFYIGLKSGKLHSAGIDVWYNYPKDESDRKNTPPSDFPFSELPNVVMSPHRGGGSDEVEKLRMDALSVLINEIHNNEDVSNRVNLDQGY